MPLERLMNMQIPKKIILIMVVAACTSERLSGPLVRNIEDIYWSAEVNHPAVILSHHEEWAYL